MTVAFLLEDYSTKQQNKTSSHLRLKFFAKIASASNKQFSLMSMSKLLSFSCPRLIFLWEYKKHSWKKRQWSKAIYFFGNSDYVDAMTMTPLPSPRHHKECWCVVIKKMVTLALHTEPRKWMNESCGESSCAIAASC